MQPLHIQPYDRAERDRQALRERIAADIAAWPGQIERLPFGASSKPSFQNRRQVNEATMERRKRGEIHKGTV